MAYFFKFSILLVVCLVCTLKAQSQERLNLVFSNNFSHSLFLKNKEDQTGRYGLGAELRFRPKLTSKPLWFQLGLAYYQHKTKTSFLIQEDQWETIKTVHFVSIPFYLSHKINTAWYAKYHLALSTIIQANYQPFKNGQKRSSSSSNTQPIENLELGLGAAIGRNLLEKEKWQLFIEGQLKAYSVLAPIRDYNDSVFFLREGELPFFMGVNIGIGF